MQPVAWSVLCSLALQGMPLCLGGNDTLPPAPPPDAEKRVAKISQALRELKDEETALLKRFQEDKSPGREERALKEAMAFRAQRAERTFKLAQEYPGDPELIPLLREVVSDNGTLLKSTTETRRNLGRALKILKADFVESESIEQFCHYLCEYQAAELPESLSLLRAAVQQNPHRSVQGLARLSLAVILHSRCDDHRTGEAERQRCRQEAERLLEGIRTKYADVTMWNDKRVQLGTVAEARLFELRHLSIGEQAQEIGGKDLSGALFKLSDYRGRVVVLDFWHMH